MLAHGVRAGLDGGEAAPSEERLHADLSADPLQSSSGPGLPLAFGGDSASLGGPCGLDGLDGLDAVEGEEG